VHELSLITDLLCQVKKVVAENGGFTEDIRIIRVTVGRLSGVEPEALRFAFITTITDSPFALAELEITMQEPALHCRVCGSKNEVTAVKLVCPDCGSQDIEIEAGRDFLLTSIDVEEKNGNKGL